MFAVDNLLEKFSFVFSARTVNINHNCWDFKLNGAVSNFGKC